MKEQPLALFLPSATSRKCEAIQRRWFSIRSRRHSETKRDVKNKENHETLAEFAWLDGAILFNREGVASDAGRYIQVPSGLTPKSGEGGRHLAARAISQLTDGVSIAVSSTGSIVLYANGRERYRVRIK